MSVRRNLTVADGQVAATATEIVAGQSDSGCWVNVTFSNTGLYIETLVLTLVRNGGTARRVCRVVLEPDEWLVLSGQPLNQSDSLKGATTRARVVDYVVSVAPEGTRLAAVIYDADGSPKVSSADLERVADAQEATVTQLATVGDVADVLAVLAEIQEQTSQVLMHLGQ